MTDPSDPALSSINISNAFVELTERARRVRTAPPQQWSAAVADLIGYCKDNPAVSRVVDPLRAQTIDIAQWWYARTQAVPQGVLFSGVASFDIPTDAERKAALALQFLTYAVETGLDYHRVAICLAGLGGSSFVTRLQEVYDLLIGPFVRFVEARLRELDHTVRPRSAAEPVVPLTINAHNVVAGTFHNSAIALEASHVTQGTTYQATSDDGRAIQSLVQLLADVNEGQRAALQSAIDTLARAADSANGDAIQAVQAAQQIVSASPGLRARATAILDSAIGRAAGTGLAAAAPYVFTHAPMWVHAVALALTSH